MTRHWRPDPPPSQALRASHPGARTGRFELAFGRHGTGTRIGRQFISYPFHFTRPFALDRAIPSLLTVYQQSSSGGFYRDDRLSNRFDLTAAAAAHVTTQAATVVHDCQGMPAFQETAINARTGSFLAFTPDPMILFPHASLSSQVDVRLEDGAVVLLQDAFTWHDPKQSGLMFARNAASLVVRDAAGHTLLRDRSAIEGDALSGSTSPVGPWRIVGNHMLLGDMGRMPARDEIAAAATVDGAVAGVSALPNGAGWGIRWLAASAIAARHLSDRLLSAGVLAALGALPAARRK